MQRAQLQQLQAEQQQQQQQQQGRVQSNTDDIATPQRDGGAATAAGAESRTTEPGNEAGSTNAGRGGTDAQHDELSSIGEVSEDEEELFGGADEGDEMELDRKEDETDKERRSRIAKMLKERMATRRKAKREAARRKHGEVGVRGKGDKNSAA